jgi:1-acyl-sn-glycerol-3-phosphate acyltransferase
MGSPLRALTRIAIYLAWTALLLPVQVLALVFDRRLSVRLPVFYHRVCARLLGLHVVVHGDMTDVRPALFVCNHTSYLDITVLASVIPGSFVAKAEIADWPFFGLLAKLQRTVFIDRRGPRAAEHRDDMVKRLIAGDRLILFPEGTSSDGNRVLPFKSALFSVAEQADGERLLVQPVSVAYTRLDGMPIGRGFRPYCAWYGEMGMLDHMWELIGLGVITVEVTFHEPVRLDQFGSRKTLAEHCQNVVAGGLAAAIAGRPRAAAALAAA